MTDPAIQVRDLTFRYRPGQPPALLDVRMDALPGERCLLVGANGAGKTTLLRVVGGRHMVPEPSVRVLGRPAFEDTTLAAEVSYIGGTFNVDVDVGVSEMLRGRDADPARLRRLLEVLDVDTGWRMHRISDGQRRRVQLLLGLLAPCRVLLLDEITTDLDLIGRADLLALLLEESLDRGACILYATHIFDRLEGWATHVALLERGRLRLKAAVEDLDELSDLRRQGALSPLSRLVETWMRSGRRGGA